MPHDLSKSPELIQKIITERRVVREQLMNQVIELLKSMPAGYGMTIDGFRNQAIARLRAVVDPNLEDNNGKAVDSDE